MRTIYICCNKEDTEIWHLWQGCCDLDTAETPIKASISLTKVMTPPTNSVSLCI